MKNVQITYLYVELAGLARRPRSCLIGHIVVLVATALVLLTSHGLLGGGVSGRCGPSHRRQRGVGAVARGSRRHKGSGLGAMGSLLLLLLIHRCRHSTPLLRVVVGTTIHSHGAGWRVGVVGRVLRGRGRGGGDTILLILLLVLGLVRGLSSRGPTRHSRRQRVHVHMPGRGSSRCNGGRGGIHGLGSLWIGYDREVRGRAAYRRTIHHRSVW